MISTGSPGVKRMNKKTTIATPNIMGIVAKTRSKTLTAFMEALLPRNNVAELFF
jgi:hypothetical protein